MVSLKYPRLVIGGLAGDSGKTVLSCGIISSLIARNFNVSAFKKGPDYIDTAWLSIASGNPARNLDTFLMGFETVKDSFLKNGMDNGINIIEGNRGIFDGSDVHGTHSTAVLAKLLDAPIIIVQNVTKVTRTAAAAILGCKTLDPDLKIAGVVLNRSAGRRHTKIASEAIEDITGIPVLGTIPKLDDESVFPSRHLGLITPSEFEQKVKLINDLGKIIEENVDIEKVIAIAGGVDPIGRTYAGKAIDEVSTLAENVRIGYFKDRSFSFYYPENLEMLASAGAEIVPVSAVEDSELKDLDALYIGGGFPETNLTGLTLNKKLLVNLRELAKEGFPIYAECGGLMYLAESVETRSGTSNLAGILPIKIKMNDKPQGHGYSEVKVDIENPYFPKGSIIKGHEFHYSKIIENGSNPKTALSVKRGAGCLPGRDGLIYKNVFASYLHIHALATPEWVSGMMRIAKEFKKSKLKATNYN